MDKDLKELFNDWTDWDVAAFTLAKKIGLLHSSRDKFHEVKYLFWTNNQVGNSLQNMLDQLAQCGALEYREEPDRQFRWNKDFTLKSST